MNKLDRFCEAIMHFEGWFPGSRSYRNCNPGNLRYSRYQERQQDGYAVFRNFEEGWKGLRWDVEAKAMGRTSTHLTGDSTIEEFFRVYAPADDDNKPLLYAKNVIARAGLPKTAKLRDVMS